MLGPQAHNFAYLPQPGGHALAGQPPYEVQADIATVGRAQGVVGPHRVLDRMRPPQKGQHVVVQGLHPQRYPVDPGPDIGPGRCSGQGFRVGLHTDFGVVVQPKGAADAAQDGAQDIRRHQAGRAPSEKHGAHGGPPQPIRPPGHFHQQRVHPQLHALLPVIRRGVRVQRQAPAGQRLGIKGAITAFATAKRNVDVQKHESP